MTYLPIYLLEPATGPVARYAMDMRFLPWLDEDVWLKSCKVPVHEPAPLPAYTPPPCLLTATEEAAASYLAASQATRYASRRGGYAEMKRRLNAQARRAAA